MHQPTQNTACVVRMAEANYCQGAFPSSNRGRQIRPREGDLVDTGGTHPERVSFHGQHSNARFIRCNIPLRPPHFILQLHFFTLHPLARLASYSASWRWVSAYQSQFGVSLLPMMLGLGLDANICSASRKSPCGNSATPDEYVWISTSWLIKRIKMCVRISDRSTYDSGIS